jgi:drug/metabolite transporter (DMT)-like permease
VVTRGAGAVICGCIATAAGTLLSKKLLATLPPVSLMAVEISFSAAAFWTAAAALRRLPPRRGFWRVSSPGFLQPGLAWVLILVGLKTVPASIEALLFAAETFIVMLAAWPLLRERPTALKLLLCALSTAGVALVTRAGAPIADPPLAGVLLIFAGVICAALDTVLSRKLLSSADPLAMTAAIHVPSLLVVGAAVLLWPEAGAAALFSPAILVQAALAGLLLHGGAALLFNRGLVTLDAGTAALLFPLLTVMTVSGGLCFFDERLGPGQWLGALLILAAALGVGLVDRK